MVVGAGPAGLSAGIHLLEQARGAVDVELVSMGHLFGGKAASWRDHEGYVIDHGFHAVFGFYEQMRALLRRAGVNLRQALIPSGGLFRYFDVRTGALEEVQFAHNGLVQLARNGQFPGLTASERATLTTAFLRMAATVARAPLESLDDLCYRAFALTHGVPRAAFSHPIWREVYELAFNHPHEMSAYIMSKWALLAGHCFHDATFSYIAGSMSEQLWDPLAAYFCRLGGVVRRWEKLVHLDHAGGRLTGLRFGVPDQARHHQGGAAWPDAVPVAPGIERLDRDFDAAICTVPAACFVELNPGDQALWSDPFFGDLRNLTSVSTLSLQVWLKEPTPGRVAGSIATLPRPLGYAIDYKDLVPEYERDERYGAALEWVGGEVGYETLTDGEVVEGARAGLAQVPGFFGTDAAEVVHLSLIRNRANHRRYLLTDPGTLRFRPTVETPLKRLFLAGDWVRNEVDGPCMEGAIRCGQAAARAALQRL